MNGQEGSGHLANAGIQDREGQGQRLALPGWAVPLQVERQTEEEKGHQGSLALRSRLWGLEKYTGLFLGSCWLCSSAVLK